MKFKQFLTLAAMLFVCVMCYSSTVTIDEKSKPIEKIAPDAASIILIAKVEAEKESLLTPKREYHSVIDTDCFRPISKKDDYFIKNNYISFEKQINLFNKARDGTVTDKGDVFQKTLLKRFATNRKGFIKTYRLEIGKLLKPPLDLNYLNGNISIKLSKKANIAFNKTYKYKL